MQAGQKITARSAQSGCPASPPPILRGTADNLRVRNWQSANPKEPAPSPENQSCRHCDQSARPPPPLVHPPLALLESLPASTRRSSIHLPPPAPADPAAERTRAASPWFRCHRAPQTVPALRLRLPNSGSPAPATLAQLPAQ